MLEYSGKYRPLTPINRQVQLLEALYEARGVWLSRIDEAVRGRAGLLTEARLRERAEELGLIPKSESPWKANTQPRAESERLKRGVDDAERGDHIEVFRAGVEKLMRVDPELAEQFRQALDWIEAQRLGR